MTTNDTEARMGQLRRVAESMVDAVLAPPPAPASGECLTCFEIRERHGGFGPRHAGSESCESGSIASGGDRAHCSCDRCF